MPGAPRPVATVVNSLQLDDAGLAALLEPRRDVVIETRGDAGAFVALEAPFSHSRRLVEAVPLDEPDPATEPGSDSGARFAVTETTTGVNWIYSTTCPFSQP